MIYAVFFCRPVGIVVTFFAFLAQIQLNFLAVRSQKRQLQFSLIAQSLKPETLVGGPLLQATEAIFKVDALTAVFCYCF